MEQNMRWRTIKKLKREDFRRLTGLDRAVFEKMLAVLRRAEREKKKRGGRSNNIALADRLLMTLMYWREYRTFFHIAQTYGIGESVCWRNIRWIEDALIKSGAFRLPGKKELLKSDVHFEVVLIDATETPVERPKKNSGDAIPAKRSATR
jgi:Helix-turn-helix of DDE superfamily endonuclease